MQTKFKIETLLEPISDSLAKVKATHKKLIALNIA